MGSEKCHTVRYELLVTDTETTLRNIMKFLDEPWKDEMLNHSDNLNDVIKPKGPEASGGKVIKEINTLPLTEWTKDVKDFHDDTLANYFVLTY